MHRFHCLFDVAFFPILFACSCMGSYLSLVAMWPLGKSMFELECRHICTSLCEELLTIVSCVARGDRFHITLFGKILLQMMRIDCTQQTFVAWQLFSIVLSNYNVLPIDGIIIVGHVTFQLIISLVDSCVF